MKIGAARMIDPEDNGLALALAVAASIGERFPLVEIVRPPLLDPNSPSTLTTFDPNCEGAANVWLWANFDWSCTLGVGQYTFWDDEPMEGSEADWISRVVTRIRDIGENGVIKARSLKFLGVLSPSFVGTPNDEVMRRLLPRRSTKTVKSFQAWE